MSALSSWAASRTGEFSHHHTPIMMGRAADDIATIGRAPSLRRESPAAIKARTSKLAQSPARHAGSGAGVAGSPRHRASAFSITLIILDYLLNKANDDQGLADPLRSVVRSKLL